MILYINIKKISTRDLFVFYMEEETNMGNFNKGGFNKSFGPREMHKATCSECGQECQVPFKPQEGKPVYCKDCYAKKKKF